MGSLETHPNVQDAHSTIGSTGATLLRYGLVVVIGWIGAMKFTSYEAYAIQPLIADSPLMSWLYSILSVQGFSNSLGIFELICALLIAIHPFSARASAIGSIMAIVLFVGTLSFLFTTEGIGEPTAGGFPILSSTGQFLIKDLVLFGASIWALSNSLAAMKSSASARA